MIEGQAIRATYAIDANGKETLRSVAIDGAAPTDVSAAVAALAESGVSSTDFALMDDGSAALQGSEAAEFAALRGEVSPIIASFNANNDSGFAPDPTDVANQIGGVVGQLNGVANLIRAIQSNNPLSIATASVTELSQFTGFDSALANSDIGFGLAGVSSVLQAVGNVNRMVDAINRGDIGQTLISGLGVAQNAIGVAQVYMRSQLSALNAAAQEPGLDPTTWMSIQDNIASVNESLQALQDVGLGVGAAIAGASAIQSFTHGDVVGGIINTIEAVANIIAIIVPQAAPFIFAAEAIVAVVQAIFGGLFGGGQPIHWQVGGMTHLEPNGSGGVQVVMDTNLAGGGQQALSVMQGYANAINNMVTTLRANGFDDAAVIPERLSPLRDGHGVQLERDSETQWSLFDWQPDGTREQVDFEGEVTPGQRVHLLDPSHPDFFRQDFTSTFMSNVLANGIGHQWEADTARLQAQTHAGFNAQSALVHARDAGLMETNTTTPTETVKLVTLNFDATPIPVARRTDGRGVLFDINNNGYANAMDWVGPRVGILGIDRDGDGKLDNGQDLLNDMRFKAGGRGVRALIEFDTTGTAKLTSADPVFSHLRVWRDYNQNGVQEAKEVRTLAQLGITEIDYGHWTFTQNGVVKVLSETSLTADRQGVITQAVNGGVVIHHEDGTSEELVTQVGDLSQGAQWGTSRDGRIIAGYDLVNGVGNERAVIGVSQLLANDIDVNPNGGVLTIDIVAGALNGSVALSSDGKTISFTPTANFAGAGQFGYRVHDAAGNVAIGTVQVNIAHVDQAPTISVAFDQVTVGVGSDGKYFNIDPNTYTDETRTVDNPYSGRVLVSDVDDASGFTFEIVNGMARIDSSGNWQFPSYTFDGLRSAFEVRVTDPHGQSVTQRFIVDATAFGSVGVQPTDQGNVDWGTPFPGADPGTGETGTGTGDTGTGTGETGTGTGETGTGETGTGTGETGTGTGDTGTGTGGDGGDADPIALDLDGNGIQFSNGTVPLDFGSGALPYAWIKAPDAFLAYDANANSKVDSPWEINFVQYKPGAKTDLEGLSAFDTNHDGQIDDSDSATGGLQFGWLAVWRDLNQDGVAQNNEVQSIAAAGIKAISLASTGAGTGVGVGRATFYGATTVVKADGSTIMAADLALYPRPELQFNPVADLMGFSSTDTLANGAVATIRPDGSVDIDYTPGATAGDRRQVTISADSSTLQYRLYRAQVDGGSVLDRVATVVTNYDGSRVARVVDVGNSQPWQSITRNYNAAGVLLSSITTMDDLFGTNGLPPFDVLGTAGNDMLSAVTYGNAVYGFVGTDQLTGGNANDYLDGGVGIDVMRGAAGNDSYVVDNSADRVIEAVGAGSDTLYTSVNFALESGSEVETVITVTATGVTLGGNQYSNTLYGNSGNDSLSGGSGGDTLQGGAGKDSLVGDIGNDTLIGGLGNDTMDGGGNIDTADYSGSTTAVTVDLGAGTATGSGSDTLLNIENVVGSAQGDTLTGSTLANVLAGGSGNDQLAGSDGNDTLQGDAGDDALSGGIGNDTLHGGDGNDRLMGGAGTDTLDGDAGVDTVDYSALSTAVTVDLRTGVATGDGTDTLVDIEVVVGSSGDDTLKGGASGDTLKGGIGDDTVLGKIGNDVLDGGTGADTLKGGSGNDAYFVDDPGDVVFESTGAAFAMPVGWTLMGTADFDGDGEIDVVVTNGTYNQLWLVGSGVKQLAISLPNLSAQGMSLIGIADANGDGYVDILYDPGTPDQKYAVFMKGEKPIGQGATDVTVADPIRPFTASNQGKDAVIASISYILPTAVEDLTLATGAGAIDGTGNASANVITGNESANVLSGEAGNDTLRGGDGDDRLSGDAGNDTLDGGAGIDTADYSASTAAVTVDLAAGSATGQGTDTLSSIEVVLGGTGGDVLTGSDASDQLDGGAGSDTLTGGDGNDTLLGGAGNDSLAGGAGIDTADYSGVGVALTVNLATGTAVGDGNDTLSGIEVVLGGSASDSLTGGAGNDTLRGGLGNDTLNGAGGGDELDGGVGIDTMAGGAGNDTYVVDNVQDQAVEAVGGGTDTVITSVDYALTDGQEVENLKTVRSTGLSLTGNSLDNEITGGAGDDTLDGAAGADTMSGGTGNDVYHVDNAADQVLEQAGGGTDNVYASDDFTLGAGQEIEFLRGVGTAALVLTGNELDDYVIGGAGNDRLSGGAGDDVLRGGLGVDTMVGSTGDDFYYVDNAADRVIEFTGRGSDTVYTTVDYTLDAAQEIETFRATGLAALHLVGNGFNNYLIGANGDDTLDAGAGDDKLNGMVGADTMSGGVGNDVYYVDEAADHVLEAVGEGSDTVYATADYALAAGQEVETMRVSGSAGLALTGNAFANFLYGGSGDDKLDGGAGSDTLTGGAGDDSYYVDDVADQVVERADGGTDNIYASVNYALAAGQEVEYVRVNSSTGLTITGNAFDDWLIGGAGNDALNGGDGNDRLNGGAGTDTLAGGAGSDVYYVDRNTDQVIEDAGEGTDTVYTTASYTLSATQEIESLRASGTAGLGLIGNTLNNMVYGGIGNDTLRGGAGNDTLRGCDGDDNLFGDTGNDTFAIARGDGNDIVHASTASGASDTIKFDAGVAHDQIWLAKSGTDLLVSVIGQDQTITVSNYYTSAAYHVGQIVAGDGQTLDDADIDDLVQAMAGFTPPASGQTTLPSSMRPNLDPALAANWHA
jgi:Ca2+-binding RTX toxin-like protein